MPKDDIVTRVADFLGVNSLNRANIASLKPSNVNLPRFQEMFGNWASAYVVPALPAGTMRPLLLANYGEHNVHVELTGSYDPSITLEAPTPSLAQLLGYSSQTRHRAAKSAEAVVEHIKTYLLYSHSLAIEYPGRLERYARPESAFEFIRLVATLAPLLDDGVVVLIPDLDWSPLEPKTSPELLSALELITGVDTSRRTSYPSLRPERDPFGPLDGPYAEGLREFLGGDGWPPGTKDPEVSEVSFRGERLINYARSLEVALRSSWQLVEVDPLISQRELLLLQKLLEAARLEIAKYVDARRAVAIDSFVQASPLHRLKLPVGRLSSSDIIAIRRGGEFEPFRLALSRGLRVLNSMDVNQYLDPKSASIAEIRYELELGRRTIDQDIRKSRRLRDSLIQSSGFTLAGTVGAIDAIVETPLQGAGLGVAAFLLTQWLQWTASRLKQQHGAYIAHLALFDNPLQS